MKHPIHRVTAVKVLEPYVLEVEFEDETHQIIDLEPILQGKLYGPLRDTELFGQVEVDAEVHTLVWPNGADFDPAVLHDWPQHAEQMQKLARQWAV